MDYGRYFKLDSEASDLAAGIAVFRYRADGETDSPIYAALTHLGIEFNIVGTAINSQLLHLPLDDNLSEGDIGMILARNFNRKVPIPELEGYTLFQTSDADWRGYFSVFFNSGKGIRDSIHPWNLWSNDKTSISLAKLILDFLFDLRETRVFQMSPHYMEIIRKLRENFFFRALAAKAGYLYQRMAYSAAIRKGAEHFGRSWKQRGKDWKRFYGELFFKAEEEWTACIRDPRSSETFHGSGGWFQSSEKEMKHVYSFWPRLNLDATKMAAKKGNDKLSSRWFISRYEVGFVWRVWPFHQSFLGWHLFLPRVFVNIAAGWFTFVLMQNFSGPKLTPGGHAGLICAMLIMVLCCCYIFIRRMSPLLDCLSVARRSLQLTIAALIISAIIGYGMLFALNDPTINQNNFAFFLVAASYFGIFIQLFVNEKNPSDAL